MTTWSNLFDGYNAFTDVFTHYPELYLQAAQSDAWFLMLSQFVWNIGADIIFLFFAFFIALIPIVTPIALFHIFFMPLIRRAQFWK